MIAFVYLLVHFLYVNAIFFSQNWDGSMDIIL